MEKSKEDMLNQLYSSIRFNIVPPPCVEFHFSYGVLICALLYLIYSAIGNERIESLIQEDQNVKGKRERYLKQSSLLSKLTRQLSVHDNRAAAASSWSDNGSTGKLFFLIWAVQCWLLWATLHTSVVLKLHCGIS